MRIGIVGLGRMGTGIARRLMRNGHECVVYDRAPGPVSQLAQEGAVAAKSIDDLVGELQPPRVVWIMLPAGAVTEAAIVASSAALMCARRCSAVRRRRSR